MLSNTEMDNLFPPYAIFSTLAILAKLWIFIHYRKELSSCSIFFKLLFACLFWLNIFELVSFYYPSADRFAYSLLVSYYLCFLVVLGMLTCISLSTAGSMNVKAGSFIAGVVSIGILMTIIPGLFLDGVRHIGFTVTRVPGDYYWVFQAMLVVFIIVNVAALSWTATRSEERWRRLRSKSLLISLTPLFLLMPMVLVLMHMGIPVTGTVFGSFAILFFLATVVVTETEMVKEGHSTHGDHSLFKFLSNVPVTREFQLANRVRRAVATKYSKDLDEAVASYEATLVKEALGLCGENKTAAAKLLGISRATLRRKLQD